MSYLGAAPGIAPIPDPWYQQKARELQRLSRGVGQTSSGEPPARGAISVPLMIGWAAIVAATAGIFWFTTMRDLLQKCRRRDTTREEEASLPATQCLPIPLPAQQQKQRAERARPTEPSPIL